LAFASLLKSGEIRGRTPRFAWTGEARPLTLADHAWHEELCQDRPRDSRDQHHDEHSVEHWLVERSLPPSRPQSRQLVPLLAGAVMVFGVIPALGNDYWFNAILIPFFVLSLTALGLNVLTGYAGRASLGSDAVMSVGAFASYNFLLRLPMLPLPIALWV
jgi:hypothetical protein